MSDLIDRQDALRALSKEVCGDKIWALDARDAIVHLPSAEPEQKTGEWIVRTRHEHYPSGKEYQETVCSLCGRTDHNGDGNYCGYCGAKMEGEEDD